MKRRTLLQAAAAGAAVFGAAPLWAQARGLVLVAGLPSDDAFVLGTGLQRRVMLRRDVQGYAALVRLLRQAPGTEVMALLDASHALLLEQAARDSGALLAACRPVQAGQARAAGAWLAQGAAPGLAPRAAGPLQAMHLRT